MKSKGDSPAPARELYEGANPTGRRRIPVVVSFPGGATSGSQTTSPNRSHGRISTTGSCATSGVFAGSGALASRAASHARKASAASPPGGITQYLSRRPGPYRSAGRVNIDRTSKAPSPRTPPDGEASSDARQRGRNRDHVEIPDTARAPKSMLRSALRERDRENALTPPDEVRVPTEEPLEVSIGNPTEAL